MRVFDKSKTTENQLFQVFMDDFLEANFTQAEHPKYRENKIKEYNYLKTI
jgi:hypothetical protein